MHDRTEIVTIGIIAVTVLTSMGAFSNPLLFVANVLDVQAVLKRGEHLRIITSGFFHNDWQHLIFNMFSFYFFGSALELHGGIEVLIGVYFSAIVGGSFIALLIHRKEEYRAVGASGGVCGVIFATIFYVPGTSVIIFPVPMPIPAWLYAIVFIGGSVWAGKVRRDNVGHDAHLGGALVGLFVATLFNPAIALGNPLLYGVILIGGIAGVIYLTRTSII